MLTIGQHVDLEVTITRKYAYYRGNCPIKRQAFINVNGDVTRNYAFIPVWGYAMSAFSYLKRTGRQ